MALLQKLKSMLGLGGSDRTTRENGDVGVTVEREASDRGDEAEDASTETHDGTGADDERPDTETADDAVAADTDAASSTGALVDEPERSDEAAEPGEATGPTETDAAPTEEKTDAGVATTDVSPDDTVEDSEETADEPDDAPDATPDEPDQSDEAGEGDDGGEGDEADEGEPVDVIKGIGPAYADRLASADVETVAELAAADPADLSTQTDISEKRIQGWIDRAKVR